jgi:hypothetical protein
MIFKISPFLTLALALSSLDAVSAFFGSATVIVVQEGGIK